MPISQELLEVLACPKCRGGLEYNKQRGLICRTCALLYKIENDIPVMLLDEAVEIEQHGTKEEN